MSAFSLGSIRAVLGIETGGYTKGLLDAQVANEVFGHSIVNFVNNPLLGTIQLLKGAVVATSQAIKETADLNEGYLLASERLGIAVRTISGLQLAYRDLGSSSEELERHLVILSKLVDDAANGNETAEKTFARLGVSVTDTAGEVRSLDDIFRDVSDGLAALENAQAKVNVANDLFGQGAEKVISIIGAGSQVIEENIAVAEKWGQTVTDRDARAARTLNDALDEVNFTFEGFKRNVATRFTTGFVEEFGNAGTAADQFRATLKETGEVAEELGRAVAPAISGLTELLRLFNAFAKWRDEKLFAWIIDAPVEAVMGTVDEVDAKFRARDMLQRFRNRQIELEQADGDFRYQQAQSLRAYIRNFGPLRDGMLAARMAL